MILQCRMRNKQVSEISVANDLERDLHLLLYMLGTRTPDQVGFWDTSYFFLLISHWRYMLKPPHQNCLIEANSYEGVRIYFFLRSKNRHNLKMIIKPHPCPELWLIHEYIYMLCFTSTFHRKIIQTPIFSNGYIKISHVQLYIIYKKEKKKANKKCNVKIKLYD